MPAFTYPRGTTSSLPLNRELTYSLITSNVEHRPVGDEILLLDIVPHPVWEKPVLLP